MVTNNSTNEPTAASGKVLQGQGVGTTSAFSTATYPATATGTGTLLRADGTNWVATTSTYPDTNAVSTLLYASSANVMGALATANTGVLTTNSSGVPSFVSARTTYTPTATGATTPGTQTYTAQVGSYVRLGPIVIVNFVVTGTFGATAAGNCLISMPVTSLNSANVNNFGSGFFATLTDLVGTWVVQPNQTSAFFLIATSGAIGQVSATNAFNFQGTICYFTA